MIRLDRAHVDSVCRFGAGPPRSICPEQASIPGFGATYRDVIDDVERDRYRRRIKKRASPLWAERAQPYVDGLLSVGDP